MHICRHTGPSEETVNDARIQREINPSCLAPSIRRSQTFIIAHWQGAIYARCWCGWVVRSKRCDSPKDTPRTILCKWWILQFGAWKSCIQVEDPGAAHGGYILLYYSYKGKMRHWTQCQCRDRALKGRSKSVFKAYLHDEWPLLMSKFK